jgi:hypothetical protein
VGIGLVRILVGGGGEMVDGGVWLVGWSIIGCGDLNELVDG